MWQMESKPNFGRIIGMRLVPWNWSFEISSTCKGIFGSMLNDELVQPLNSKLTVEADLEDKGSREGIIFCMVTSKGGYSYSGQLDKHRGTPLCSRCTRCFLCKEIVETVNHLFMPIHNSFVKNNPKP